MYSRLKSNSRVIGRIRNSNGCVTVVTDAVVVTVVGAWVAVVIMVIVIVMLKIVLVVAILVIVVVGRGVPEKNSIRHMAQILPL